jgi:hypothetical protein
MSNTSNRWIIAGAGVLMQIALGAVYAWSVFRIPLARTYGWSISQVTFAFELTIVVLGFASFAGGLLMRKTGPRPIALLAAVLYGVGTSGKPGTETLNPDSFYRKADFQEAAKTFSVRRQRDCNLGQKSVMEVSVPGFPWFPGSGFWFTRFWFRASVYRRVTGGSLSDLRSPLRPFFAQNRSILASPNAVARNSCSS